MSFYCFFSFSLILFCIMPLADYALVFFPFTVTLFLGQIGQMKSK